MRPDLRLRVDGRSYGGWKEIGVDLGIEMCANAFDLAVSDRWVGNDVSRPIAPGAPCEVTIDGEVVITGYVDEVAIEHRGDDHRVRVRGRDKTGDLVDCSAIHGAGAWSGATLMQIAQDLAAPFGIAVRAEVDLGAPLLEWQVQEGESVFECLERAARLRGVLLTTDGRGTLVFTRASTAHIGASLKLGYNVLGASGQFSMHDRYSAYFIKGQSPGSDWKTVKQITAPSAAATDAGVPRYRPLIVIGEDNGDPTIFTQRALWERNVRFGRAVRAQVAVQGWFASPGVLWRPNVLVRYVDRLLNVDADLLIAAVSYSVRDDGVLAYLTLTRREALDVEPAVLPQWGSA